MQPTFTHDICQTHRQITIVTRGVARIFQRGGHRGYSPDCHVDLHAVHVLLNATVLGCLQVMIEEKGCYLELLHQMIQLPPLDQRQTIFMGLRCISKYSSCLPAAPSKKWYNRPFLTDFYPKKVTQNFRTPFFWLKFLKR